MDRFIDRAFKGHCCVWANLKSNMDRFIEVHLQVHSVVKVHLKSNMDRFIEYKKNYKTIRTEI